MPMPKKSEKDKKINLTITITKDQREQLARIGEGNCSVGVRRLLENLKKGED